MAKTIVVKQVGSPIRRPAKQRATLIGLGLNKMNRTYKKLHLSEIGIADLQVEILEIFGYVSLTLNFKNFQIL